jgi:quercetin dioxygenase-like cupin family protein
MSDSGPQHRAWDEIEPTAEQHMEGNVTFKTLTGEVSQLLRVEMAAGVVFPAPDDPREVDSHPNEQIDIVLSGRVRFTVEGREFVLGAGEALSIPPNARHTVVVVEDTAMYETFVPPLDLDEITATEARTR